MKKRGRVILMSFFLQVLEEESDEFPETIPGNIVFVINAAPHPTFERRGDNLYTTQHITLIEALTGFTKTLKHLDHSTVELVREGITQYGFVQTIKGQGMPLENNPSKHGDLFVEYQVIFPSEIDEETIECKSGRIYIYIYTSTLIQCLYRFEKRY